MTAFLKKHWLLILAVIIFLFVVNKVIKGLTSLVSAPGAALSGALSSAGNAAVNVATAPPSIGSSFASGFLESIL
jgi:hypothetical protein